MVNNSTDPYPANTPTKNSSSWWKWLLGVLAGCLCLGCAGALGVYLHFAQDPENLLVEYSMPPIVHKGENFDLIFTITNTGSEPLTVYNINLDEVMGGSILDGAIVLETEPAMEYVYSEIGIKMFVYDQTLQPGETKQAIFHLQATTVGEFGGAIGVYTYDNAKEFNYVGLIVQE